jgi:hypothetical protein
MRTQRRLSDSEREERRERDRERLKQAAEQLLTSEGYCVGKGEKAIRIVAPMPIKQRETKTGDADEETRVLFKGVSVFDRSQVTPIDGTRQVPLGPPSEPLTGDSHRHLIDPMRAFAESLGFTVSFETIPGATGGWCDQKARRIVVDADQPANAQLRILIHGLGVGYAEFGRPRAEVIIDTAIFSPCQQQTAEQPGDSVGDRCHRGASKRDRAGDRRGRRCRQTPRRQLHHSSEPPC